VTIVRTTVLTDSCSTSGNYTDVAQPFITDTTKKTEHGRRGRHRL